MAREGESDFSQREIDGTLALLIDTKAWILRRIDRVHLIDTYTVRRTIHFEIELPDWALEAARQDDCRLILPLAVFGGGQALRNLEVTVGQDPAGTLTRHAGDTLTRLMSERLKKNGDLGIPEATREFMSLLLGTDEEPSAGKAPGKSRSAKNHAIADQARDRDTSVGTQATGSEAGNVVENAGHKKENYILFVTSDKSISNHEASGSRFVIEVKTDQTIVNGLRNPEQQPNAVARTLTALGLGRVSRLSREPSGGQTSRLQAGSDGKWVKWRVISRFLGRWTRLKRTFWPTDTAFILAQTVSGFGDARSWQLEVYAPTELRITDGALIWWPAEAGREESKLGRSNVSGATPRLTQRAKSAVAITRFRVQADGVLDLGILIGIASFTLLVMAIVIAVLGRSSAIIDAVVAVLVIAPSLGASIVTNPENHEMAGVYLRPYRRMIYLIGVASAVGAAFFIIFGLAENALQKASGKNSFLLVFQEIGESPDVQSSLLSSPTGSHILAAASLCAMLLTLAFLAILIKELRFFKKDLDKRAVKSEKLFAINGQDIYLSPFVESTSLERPHKGLRGAIWKVSREYKAEMRTERKNPFLSLSVDAIDIGPRAIFRLPKRVDDIPTYKREDEETDEVEERLASRIEGKDDGSLDPHIREGLFERFFGNVWFEDRPPDWFYWTSDIEADYTDHSGFSAHTIKRWKAERGVPEGEDTEDTGVEGPSGVDSR